MSHPQALTILSAFSPIAPRRQAATPGPMVVKIAGAADHVEVNIRLRRAFLKLRGADPTWTEARVPAATNADVLTIAQAWNRAIVSAGAFDRDSQDSVKMARWVEYQQRLADLVERRPADEVYADNGQLWDREFDRLAIWLDSRKARPKEWRMAVEATVAAFEALPDTLSSAGGAVGDALSDAGGAVGRAVVSPIVGAARGLGITGTNLLIGAGVIAGLIVIAGKR